MSRDTLTRELREIVGETYPLVEKEDVIVYEQEGLYTEECSSARA